MNNKLPWPWSLWLFKTSRLFIVCYSLASRVWFCFHFSRAHIRRPLSPFLIDIPCCIMFLTDWSGIRDGVLCVNAVWIIHIGLSESEREKGHFRNQLARPLTMNNWSELIKICRDYPSPPQQIKRHTSVCCPFTYSPLSLLPSPFKHVSINRMLSHSVWRNVRHFSIVSVLLRQLDF